LGNTISASASPTEETLDSIRSVQKILGEPIACELSDRAWKTRTLLLSVEGIAAVIAFGHLRVDPNATAFGLSLRGLTDHEVRLWLCLVIAYLLVHFIWSSWETFAEWRLRLTGTRVAFVTTGQFASEHCDYPNDPRQSTLANWWRGQGGIIGDVGVAADQISIKLKAIEEDLRARFVTGDSAMNIVNNVCGPIETLRALVGQLRQSIDQNLASFEANRIPASLDRFDLWHRHFLQSQSLRWLAVDVLIPVFCGIAVALRLAFS
jgi:hypothetical protein